MSETANLTPYETRILRLILAGKSNVQIEVELHMAPQTLRNSISRIYAKLGMSNPRELFPRYLEISSMLKM